MKKIWFILLILFFTGCGLEEKAVSIPFKYESILSMTDNNLSGKINEYTIYGKYFNLKGIIQYQDSLDNLELVLKSKNNEISYKLIYEIKDNGVSFKTNKYINEGINLEKITVDDYVLLIKLTKEDEVYYYNLFNETKYDYVDYYTITRDNLNNYLKIDFSSFEETPFMKMEFKEKVSNKDICDIVIDPGHGGSDSGATNKSYYEKNFNLEYGLMLKEALEKLGLKVKMTRESDTLPAFYGPGSRTAIPYECKAKMMLSLHLNSSYTYVGNGGFELYMANGASSAFPKIMASSIINEANTVYSKNRYNWVDDGVYIRTYAKDDIKKTLNDSIKGNWPMYETVNEKTTYYYFIRETGGIITNAVNDGRNPEYPKNDYYDSNHGTESYLLELGYISSANNLKHLINEKEGYIKGIVLGVRNYINN